MRLRAPNRSPMMVDEGRWHWRGRGCRARVGRLCAAMGCSTGAPGMPRPTWRAVAAAESMGQAGRGRIHRPHSGGRAHASGGGSRAPGTPARHSRSRWWGRRPGAQCKGRLSMFGESVNVSNLCPRLRRHASQLPIMSTLDGVICGGGCPLSVRFSERIASKTVWIGGW